MAACMKSRARSVAPAFLSRLGIVSAVLVLGLPVASSYCSQPTANSYSRRLGIYFTLERYGSGYGARLTADPVPGSPLRQAQVQLERGDMVTFVDSMPIRGPEDLENHYGQTAVAFVNVRTGAAEARWVYLPALSDPGLPTPASYADRSLPPITDVPDAPPPIIDIDSIE